MEKQIYVIVVVEEDGSYETIMNKISEFKDCISAVNVSEPMYVQNFTGRVISIVTTRDVYQTIIDCGYETKELS